MRPCATNQTPDDWPGRGVGVRQWPPFSFHRQSHLSFSFSLGRVTSPSLFSRQSHLSFSFSLGRVTPPYLFRTPLGNSQGDLSFSGISPPLGSCFIRRFFSFSLHLKSNLLWCFHEKKLKFSESSQTAGPKPPRPNGAHHDLHASSQSAFVPFPRSESF